MAKKKDDAKAKSSTEKSSTEKSGAVKSGAGATRRVAKLRDKLTDAMQDPPTRDQIVRAIRALMQEK